MTTPHPLAGLKPDRATIERMLFQAQLIAEAIKATQITKETQQHDRTSTR